MTTLIVGGDRIDTYSDFLSENGFGPVLHWKGRKQSECHRMIPRKTRLVAIVVDQVSHGLTIRFGYYRYQPTDDRHRSRARGSRASRAERR